jgi:hypothetical protein
MNAIGRWVAGFSVVVMLLFAPPANADTSDQLARAIARNDAAALSRIAASEKGRDAAGSMLVARIRSGDSAAVRMLLDAGADKATERGQASLLMHAAQAGQLDVARLLLDHGVDVNERENALVIKPWSGPAPSTSGSFNVIRMGKINISDADTYAGNTSNYRLEGSPGAGHSAMSYAVAGKHIELVKLFLQRGADKNLTIVTADPEFGVVNVLGNAGRRSVLRHNNRLEINTSTGQEVFFENMDGYVTTNSMVKPQPILSLKELAESSGVPEMAKLFE